MTVGKAFEDLVEGGQLATIQRPSAAYEPMQELRGALAMDVVSKEMKYKKSPF